MRKGLVVLLLMVLSVVPAMAQYYVVPGGAVGPSGGLHYVVPTGKPFSVNTTEAYAYPPGIFGQYQYGPAYYATPQYWVPYPGIVVPGTGPAIR